MMRLALTLGFVLLVSAVPSSGSAQVSAARFGISIDGTEIAAFSRVASLGSVNEVVETTQSGAGGVVVVRRLPGKLRYRDVTIVRVFSNDTALSSWREAIENGNLAGGQKTVDLVGYNSAGDVVIRYHLENAWPSSIEVYTDQQTGLLMETVTLVTESITRLPL